MRRIDPDEARALIAEQGFVYVDVRSIPEFEAGHPEGAYNVPIAHLDAAGMAPNREFLAVMQSNFPKDARLVLGCQSGGRSLQAAALLERAGYSEVVDQRCGFEGARSGFGIEPGWRPRGLPVAVEAQAGRDYASLRGKLK